MSTTELIGGEFNGFVTQANKRQRAAGHVFEEEAKTHI
jgi:hypothetical protein